MRFDRFDRSESSNTAVGGSPSGWALGETSHLGVRRNPLVPDGPADVALLLAFRDSYTSGFRARGRETGGVARVSNVVVSTEAVATEGVLPGDSNGDGVLDLSDAVHLLGLLFLGGSETPCAKTAGSIELVDCNGDGIRDLSDAVCLLTFLFMGGPPHALGLDCVPIASCPSACPE